MKGSLQIINYEVWINESCILSEFEDGLLVLNIETGKY